MKHKGAFRANNEITQSYNDGVAEIYKTCDTAKVGFAPKVGYELLARVRFAEMKVGINRYWQAKQNHVEVAMVIRIPKFGEISTNEIVEIAGVKYNIEQIQSLPEIYPPSLDLSLKLPSKKAV